MRSHCKLFFKTIGLFKRVVPFLFLVFSAKAQGIWGQKNSIATSRTSAVAFTINGKGYLGTGESYSSYVDDLWEYDPLLDTWSQKASFPPGPRAYATGFAIGNYGYLGTGEAAGVFQNDFWRYDPVANNWIQKANVGPDVREQAFGFSIGGKGYIGTGQNTSGCLKDVWEYDTLSDSWMQKQDFPPGGRRDIDRAEFVIGNFAYLGTGCSCASSGSSPTHFQDFWRFDPVANTWIQWVRFPGTARRGAVGFSLCGYGFLCMGTDERNMYPDDVWMFNPHGYAWTQVASFPGTTRWDVPSFVIGNKAYLGTGAYGVSFAGFEILNDLWEFSYAVVAGASSNRDTVCTGSSVTISASGGTHYSWNTGDSTTSITVNPTSTTTYTVAVSGHCSSDTARTTISVFTTASSSFTYDYEPCTDKCIQFFDHSVNALTWDWDFGDGVHSAYPNPCYSYKDSATYPVTLTINSGTNCVNTFGVPLAYFAYDITADVFIPTVFSPNGDGKNDQLRFYRKNSFCLQKFEIAIYDRWGEKVFETNNIDDFWDGSFKGEPVNSGAFVYSCKLVSNNGSHQELKGSVSLIR
ncbi:MAG TPA: gliding motility-associated C-terminal domain-containing protein [Bacteroidia bacterium]|nr:gliding motility-associated C-terminal domain-containing protein [Bacteroidia bacterium]